MDDRERKEGCVGNVILGHPRKSPYLIACKCPFCDSIFTLEFSSKLEFMRYGYFCTPCPGCGTIELNWLEYRITIWSYKFIRYWRNTKTGKYYNANVKVIKDD